MNTSHPAKRRRRSARPEAECLESRKLLTAGAGNTFAIMPGGIDVANKPATVSFTLDPKNFTIPNGHIDLGIDTVAQKSSSANPEIATVTDSKGNVVWDASKVHHHMSAAQIKNSGTSNNAVIVPLKVSLAGGPQTYTVQVKGKDANTGPILVGYYLPGDVNGTGSVDQSDITATRKALSGSSKSKKYNFSADALREGRVTPQDIQYARDNLGVKTTISPIIGANLDPASDSSGGQRVTNVKVVHFSGTTTPGASITFTENYGNSQPVATVADSAGNYNVYETLGNGPNFYHVRATDSFGQTISGDLSSVTYSTAPVATPTPAATTPAPTTTTTTPTGTTTTKTPVAGGTLATSTTSKPTVSMLPPVSTAKKK